MLNNAENNFTESFGLNNLTIIIRIKNRIIKKKITDLVVYDTIKKIKFRTKFPDNNGELIPRIKVLGSDKPITVSKVMKICGEKLNEIRRMEKRNFYENVLDNIADYQFFLYGNKELKGYLFNEKKFKKYIERFVRYKIDKEIWEGDWVIKI